MKWTFCLMLAAGLAGCQDGDGRNMENSPMKPQADAGATGAGGLAKAYFAAGCFWGVESTFAKVPGVVDTAVGYSGGHLSQPTYRQVCGGGTGHAETVEVTFDPSRVSYEQLLEVFWNSHDPTTPDRQGPDVGSQYRSAVFYVDESQEAAARRVKESLEGSGRFRRPVVTQITQFTGFWRAEEYHQRYLEKHGGAACPSGG